MGMTYQWPLFFVPLIFGLVSGLDHVVPVLIWGDGVTNNEELAGNPLIAVSREDFFQIFRDVTGNYARPALIFVKEDFCAEDVPQLDHVLDDVSIDNVLYFPSVVMPLKMFEDTWLSSNYRIVAHPADKFSDNVTIHVTAIENLHKIPRMDEKVRKSYPKVIVVLTGKSCRFYNDEILDTWETSVTRSGDRDEDCGNEPTSVIIRSSSILYYSKNGPFLKTSKDADFEELTRPSTRIERRSSPMVDYTALQMSFDDPMKVTLRFLFTNKYAGYYTLANVEYIVRGNDTVILRARRDVSFPRRMSYHCSTGTLFSNGQITLRLAKFQVRLNPEGNSFGSVYDCTSFTTVPILSGLLVCSILISILALGLTMLLGIRTMDRFEDPKSKSIVVPKI